MMTQSVWQPDDNIDGDFFFIKFKEIKYSCNKEKLQQKKNYDLKMVKPANIFSGERCKEIFVCTHPGSLH